MTADGLFGSPVRDPRHDNVAEFGVELFVKAPDVPEDVKGAAAQ